MRKSVNKTTLIKEAKDREAKAAHRDVMFGDHPDTFVFPEGVKPEIQQEDPVLCDSTISPTESLPEELEQTAI